jgi:hypothetical protein
MKKNLVSLAALLLAGLFVTQNTLAASEYNKRQIKRLYEMATHPERSGNPFRIFIVDGFRDVDVDSFLNTQFENIQNVMFTSVIVTDKYGKPKRDKHTGRILVEDDDC